MKPKMIDNLLFHDLVYHGTGAERQYWSIVFCDNDQSSSLLESIMNFLRSEVRVFKEGW